MGKVDNHQLTIEDLAAAPYNPRKISDGAIAGLDASMREFGDLSGITFNIRTGNLIGGHQRVKTLRARGAQLLNGAVQVENGDRFPVRVVDWPLGKEKAANVEANNPHIGGDFTPDLRGLMDEIKLDLGDESFASLNLDLLASEAVAASPLPSDFDLGDGNIEERPDMVKVIAFVPAEHARLAKSKIREVAESVGGVIA
jgi:hypothetical protein